MADLTVYVRLERKVIRRFLGPKWEVVGTPYQGPESDAAKARKGMLLAAKIGEGDVDGVSYQWVFAYPKRQQPPPRFSLPADRRRDSRSR